jgi:hypothetical protein
MQHTWDRLIEDFIGAVRHDGAKKSSKVIDPTGRTALDAGQPWADEGAL